MSERDDAVLDWARIVGLLASMISSIYLVIVLAIGAMVLMTDWSALGCFDITDANASACAEEPAQHGLSAVRASSWGIAGTGLLAAVGAFVLTLRASRLSQLAVAMGLCAALVISAAVLQGRL